MLSYKLKYTHLQFGLLKVSDILTRKATCFVE